MNNREALCREKIGLLAVLHIVFMACKNMLVSAVPFLNEKNSILNAIALVLLIAIYAYFFFKYNILRYVPGVAYVWIILTFAFFLITFAVDPIRFLSNEFPYTYVKKDFFSFLKYCLPLFICISCVKDFKKLLEYFFASSHIYFLIAAVSFVLYFVTYSRTGANPSYSMSYGYHVLFLVAIIAVKIKLKPHFISTIELLFSILFLFVEGSRGPLVCVVAICMYLLYKKDNSFFRKVIALLFPVFVLFLIFEFDYFVSFISDILNKLGLRSRTLVALLSGNIFNDSGRNLYHEGVIEALKNSPIIGLGAFGGEAKVGLTHSLYIDILANMGFVFGSFFILSLFVTFLSIYFGKRSDIYLKSFAFMMIILFALTGFFDHSFYAREELWMFMAVGLNFLFLKNFYRKNNKIALA